jgi:phage-related protein
MHGPRVWRPPAGRPVLWRGSSLEDLRRFPQSARHEAGRQLNFIQHGGEPSDWKPMTTVGAGVMEIRIHADGEHRVLVVTKFEPGVFVLHAFAKKSRKTPRSDIDLARRRYQDLIGELAGQ